MRGTDRPHALGTDQPPGRLPPRPLAPPRTRKLIANTFKHDHRRLREVWARYGNFAADLRAANETAGLPWTCLDYRHTFGSQLAMKGESLYKISTLMGNSPDICRKHYAALIPEALIDTVEFPQASE